MSPTTTPVYVGSPCAEADAARASEVKRVDMSMSLINYRGLWKSREWPVQAGTALYRKRCMPVSSGSTNGLR